MVDPLFERLLIIASMFSSLLVIVVTALRKHAIQHPAIRLLFLLVCLSFVHDFSTELLYNSTYGSPLDHNRQLRYTLANLYTLEEIVILTAFYYFLLNFSVLRRGILIASGVLILLTLGLSALNAFRDYLPYTLPLEALYFTILALTFYYQLLQQQDFIHFERNPFFWLNSGIFIYFAANTLLFALFNQTVTGWSFHNLFHLVQNGLFLVGFLTPYSSSAKPR
jgi:hypothetical protein